MTVAEVSLPDTAITSTLMADQIPTTSGREIGITQPTHEAPVVAAEVDAPVPVLAHVPVVVAPAVARKILLGRTLSRSCDASTQLKPKQ